MALEPSKALPAYRIPKEIRKQSWSRKRKKKRNNGIPRSISDIIKK